MRKRSDRQGYWIRRNGISLQSELQHFACYQPLTFFLQNLLPTNASKSSPLPNTCDAD